MKSTFGIATAKWYTISINQDALLAYPKNQQEFILAHEVAHIKHQHFPKKGLTFALFNILFHVGGFQVIRYATKNIISKLPLQIQTYLLQNNRCLHNLTSAMVIGSMFFSATLYRWYAELQADITAIKTLDCLPAALAFYRAEINYETQQWHHASRKQKIVHLLYFLRNRLLHAPRSWEYTSSLVGRSVL